MTVMKTSLSIVFLGSFLMLPHPAWADEQTGTLGTGAAKELPATAPGRFQPTDESLKQYRYPEWFRDAKLGFWSHWGRRPCRATATGMLQKLYIGKGYVDLRKGTQAKRDDPDYADHLSRYGHPSEKGYKDIIPLWKAEKWDPDALMALYKKAGAKYFVSMGTHHDNFFLWDSKLHRWNAVQMGPHKDVVGLWQKAAKANGLPFGVSEHLAASYTRFRLRMVPMRKDRRKEFLTTETTPSSRTSTTKTPRG